MTQEEQQLLLKDLCARLSYGVKVQYYFDEGCGTWRKEIATLKGFNPKRTSTDGIEFILEKTTPKGSYRTSYESWSIKPYLRPMSSMTEDEVNQYYKIRTGEDRKKPLGELDAELFDFYHKNHIDYRGLIPMGLALEAPEGMYDEKETEAK